MYQVTTSFSPEIPSDSDLESTRRTPSTLGVYPSRNGHQCFTPQLVVPDFRNLTVKLEGYLRIEEKLHLKEILGFSTSDRNIEDTKKKK